MDTTQYSYRFLISLFDDHNAPISYLGSIAATANQCHLVYQAGGDLPFAEKQRLAIASLLQLALDGLNIPRHRRPDYSIAKVASSRFTEQDVKCFDVYLRVAGITKPVLVHG